jgi:cystathionine beta-lyase
LNTKLDKIFDNHIDRYDTDCAKYDGLSRYFDIDKTQTKQTKPLWVADMDFQSPNNIINSLQNRLNHAVLGYGEFDDSYYRSIIKWYKSNHNLNIDKDEILFSPSVLASISTCIEAFTNQNDEIIVQSPVYYPFYSLVKSANRKLLLNPLINDNNDKGYYRFDIENFKSIITKDTKMLILCSPHNPVGRVWSENELKELIEICEQNDILIISDEIHCDLAFDTFHSVYNLSKNSIVLNSASKTFNLAGLSSSYAIIQNQELKEIFENVFQSRAYSNNIFGMIALREAYSSDISKQWLDNLKTYLLSNIEICKDKLKSLNITFKSPQASYLLWLDMSSLGVSNKIIEDRLLQNSHLALNNGLSFGKEGKGYFRLNIALPQSELIEALENFKKL